jgi:uncharacterized RDD family membrane protein YckC
MVIKDLYSAENRKGTFAPQATLAPAVDRLLSSVLDLIFHGPFFTLVSSILLYRLNLLKLTVATTTEKMAVLAQIIWIVLVGTVILQSIYLKLWKKTPGMRLLKLELASLNEGELTWSQCLLRSCFWCFEILLLGFPLLEIFSHPKRHAIHDRVSETEIRTLKSWGTLKPLPQERATVHVIYSGLLMLALGWLTALFSTAQKGIIDGSTAMADWREQSRMCTQIDEVSTYSELDLTDVKNRLDFGISLFLLGQVDEECFRREIDFASLRDVPGPLLWVGLALLSAPNSLERGEYVTKACAEDSQWCHKSLFQERGDVEEAQLLLNPSERADLKKSSLAYQTTKLILVNRLGAAEEAAVLIESLQAHGIRATGLVAEHLKTVSRINPDRMPSVLNTLKSVMVEKDFMRLNSELCLHQLESGCSAKVVECDTLAKLLPKYKESLSDLTVGRALFKSSICKNDLAENMEYWTLLSSEGLQELVRVSMQIENDSTHGKGLSKIRSFIKDETQRLELRLDALQILLGESDFDDDWTLVTYLWSKMNWTQASFLSASEWLLREGRRTGKTDVVYALGDVLSIVPGLKLEWGLLKQEPQRRLPATDERKNH